MTHIHNLQVVMMTSREERKVSTSPIPMSVLGAQLAQKAIQIMLPTTVYRVHNMRGRKKVKKHAKRMKSWRQSVKL